MVALVLLALILRAVKPYEESLLVGKIVVDADDVVVESVVRVSAVGVIVGAVGCAGAIWEIVELDNRRADRVDLAGRDDVARDRCPREEAPGRRNGGVGIINLIPRAEGEKV